MDKVKRERFRRIRGLIIYHLVRAYPGPLDHYEIRCFLDDLRYTITEEELVFHLAYLEEGKYLRRDIREAGEAQRELVFATKEGINLRDGRVKDIGIDVESLP